MRRLLLAFATATIVSAPAFAQAPAQVPADRAAGEQRTQMKRVCETIETERGTGSRLSSTSRVCKMVKVPVEDAKAKDAAGGSGKTDHAPHTH
jgi:hypothetical protein